MFCFTTNIITEWSQKTESTVSVGATDMQQPMFYILLHDYFISHLLLTRHCSLHLFWRGKQIMWQSKWNSVYSESFVGLILYLGKGSYFSTWFFLMERRATAEKNWKIYNRLADDVAFQRQHLCSFHFHLFCSIPSSIYGHLL